MGDDGEIVNAAANVVATWRRMTPDQRCDVLDLCSAELAEMLGALDYAWADRRTCEPGCSGVPEHYSRTTGEMRCACGTVAR